MKPEFRLPSGRVYSGIPIGNHEAFRGFEILHADASIINMPNIFVICKDKTDKQETSWIHHCC